MIFGSILKVVASFAVLFTSLTSGTPLVGSANKDLVANQQTNSQGRPVRVIHQFPNNTWLENLAVRSNGEAYRFLHHHTIADTKSPQVKSLSPF